MGSVFKGGGGGRSKGGFFGEDAVQQKATENYTKVGEAYTPDVTKPYEAGNYAPRSRELRNGNVVMEVGYAQAYEKQRKASYDAAVVSDTAAKAKQAGDARESSYQQEQKNSAEAKLHQVSAEAVGAGDNSGSSANPEVLLSGGEDDNPETLGGGARKQKARDQYSASGINI